MNDLLDAPHEVIVETLDEENNTIYLSFVKISQLNGVYILIPTPESGDSVKVNKHLSHT